MGMVDIFIKFNLAQKYEIFEGMIHKVKKKCALKFGSMTERLTTERLTTERLTTEQLTTEQLTTEWLRLTTKTNDWMTNMND